MKTECENFRMEQINHHHIKYKNKKKDNQNVKKHGYFPEKNEKRENR